MMLTQLFPFLDPKHVHPDLGRRLRTLACDCDRFRLGQPISPLLLARSPQLENWVPIAKPLGVHLAGHVTGNPNHGSRMIHTSPLWFADPDGVWVRTLSRFYRLGTPLDADDARLLAARPENDAKRDDGAEDAA
jgi:uncharacterized protein DUF6634